jgi:hypothetical protein
MIRSANLPVSRETVHSGAAAGRITWTGPLTMLAARSIFAVLAQVLVTLILAWTRNPDPIRAGTAWWQVTGTLVDVGCLALLFAFTRREGIRLMDLVGLDKSRWRRDVVIGLALLALIFPVVMIGGSLISGLAIFGTIQPTLPAEVLMKVLPLWAVFYSRAIWWVIWSATEEITYNGYALPRLQALTGKTWLAVGIVSIGWALQHAFLPLVADWRVFLYLFLQMLPLVVVMQLLYLRLRRLPPLIIMHWGMDLFSALMMTSVMR